MGKQNKQEKSLTAYWKIWVLKTNKPAQEQLGSQDSVGFSLCLLTGVLILPYNTSVVRQDPRSQTNAQFG